MKTKQEKIDFLIEYCENAGWEKTIKKLNNTIKNNNESLKKMKKAKNITKEQVEKHKKNLEEDKEIVKIIEQEKKGRNI